MKKLLLFITIFIMVLGIQNAYADCMSQNENNIDRPGSDYKNFDLPAANPLLCKNQCAADKKCKAWTYVKPNTIQGPKPRCWLKKSVPFPKSHNCCVSGVRVVQ